MNDSDSQSQDRAGPVKRSLSDGEHRGLLRHTVRFRVRYSETDQMGTFYNSRPLEWFEYGRTELLRHVGLPYAEMERRGVFLPLVEAHVVYLGRARYDDLLEMTTTLHFEGRARVRSEVELVHAEDRRPVARGYTVHAFTDAAGKAIRPPRWFVEFFKSKEQPASRHGSDAEPMSEER